jgi:hypothetical protein
MAGTALPVQRLLDQLGIDAVVSQRPRQRTTSDSRSDDQDTTVHGHPLVRSPPGVARTGTLSVAEDVRPASLPRAALRHATRGRSGGHHRRRAPDHGQLVRPTRQRCVPSGARTRSRRAAAQGPRSWRARRRRARPADTRRPQHGACRSPLRASAASVQRCHRARRTAGGRRPRPGRRRARRRRSADRGSRAWPMPVPPTEVRSRSATQQVGMGSRERQRRRATA